MSWCVAFFQAKTRSHQNCDIQTRLKHNFNTLSQVLKEKDNILEPALEKSAEVPRFELEKTISYAT